LLLKEVIDNSIDEFIMGAGKTIEVKAMEKKITVRDYGRGVPLGKLLDCVSKINTGGKYDSEAFKKKLSSFDLLLNIKSQISDLKSHITNIFSSVISRIAYLTPSRVLPESFTPP